MSNKSFNRIKFYESQSKGDTYLSVPIVARITGMFSSELTRHLEQPFDERFHNIMIDTSKFLMRESSAIFSYVYNDEILLFWYSDNEKSELFKSRLKRVIASIASKATLYFNSNISKYIPSELANTPISFRTKLFNIPNINDSISLFLLFESNAMSKSINDFCKIYFKESSLENKTIDEKRRMLLYKGVDWNKYPNFMKYGVYLQRKKIYKSYSKEEIFKLPENHDARRNPNLIVERTIIRLVDDISMSKINNKSNFILNGDDPTKKLEFVY